MNVQGNITANKQPGEMITVTEQRKVKFATGYVEVKSEKIEKDRVRAHEDFEDLQTSLKQRWRRRTEGSVHCAGCQIVEILRVSSIFSQRENMHHITN